MFTDRYIKVGAINTRYWQAGDSGSAVLLVHGISCSVLEWERNVAALATRHRVFAVDFLGGGMTDKPEDETYDVPRLARFLLDFMTVVGVERAHLAGNSFGGRLAMECAIRSPARVASLVLVDPAGMNLRPTLFEFRLATLPWLGEILTKPSIKGTKAICEKAFFDPKPFVTDEFLRVRTELASLPGAQSAFLRTLRNFVTLSGFRPGPVEALQKAMPGIKAPTLVIWGRQDQFVPCEHADVLRRLLPNVKVEIWDRCGHTPMFEQAEAFNAAALNYWSEVDARAEEGQPTAVSALAP